EVRSGLRVLGEGMREGLAGAVLALGALVITHSLVAPRLEPLVNLTLGLSKIVFLTPVGVLALLGVGTLLGGLGGWLARAAREPGSERSQCGPPCRPRLRPPPRPSATVRCET